MQKLGVQFPEMEKRRFGKLKGLKTRMDGLCCEGDQGGLSAPRGKVVCMEGVMSSPWLKAHVSCAHTGSEKKPRPTQSPTQPTVLRHCQVVSAGLLQLDFIPACLREGNSTACTGSVVCRAPPRLVSTASSHRESRYRSSRPPISQSLSLTGGLQQFLADFRLSAFFFRL